METSHHRLAAIDMAIPNQFHPQSLSHQDVDIAMYVLCHTIPGMNAESFEYYTDGGHCASNGLHSPMCFQYSSERSFLKDLLG